MTTTQEAPAQAEPKRRRTPRFAWRASLRGVGLVAGLELRQRVRSTRWKWALAGFVALVGAVTLLISAATSYSYGERGDVVFGAVVFFVLFLGLVVSPTLAATSINGDVKEGTLAPLQATALSAADIVLGKLLGAWVASLAFVVASGPFLAFAFLQSDARGLAMVTTVLVLSAELLVVCAVGLGWSAITARPAASAVLTYFTVAALTVLSVVFFALTVTLVTTTDKVKVYQSDYAWDGDFQGCTWYDTTQEQFHSERTWWLLAVNPFVIVSDAAPVVSRDDSYYSASVLGSIKQAVREARLGPRDTYDYCWEDGNGDFVSDRERADALAGLSPVWPWGLGFHALLAAGGVYLAIRRVQVPHGVLATGTRVA